MSVSEISKRFSIPQTTLREWIGKGVHEDKRKDKSGRKSALPKIEENTYKYFQEPRKLGNYLFKMNC